MAISSIPPSSDRTDSSFQTMFYVVAIALLILTCTDFISITLNRGSIVGLLNFAVLWPMLGISALFFRYILRAASASPALVALHLLALISAFWSLHPVETIERCFSLIATTSFAMLLGSIATPRGLAFLLAGFGAAMMIVSTIAVIALPGSSGTGAWENTWTGIFNHKNGFGQASVVALILMIGASKMTQGTVRFLFQMLCLLAVLFIVVTESRTAQLLGLIAVVAVYIGYAMKRYSIVWAISFMVFIVLSIALGTFILSSSIADPLFAAIDRRPTLSSRIPLWEIVWPYAMDKFWLGYGYSAFWSEASPYIDVISSSNNLGFDVFYSHNGLLETWLNVGFVGVLLFAVASYRAIANCLTCMRILSDRKALIFHFSAIMLFFMFNITEGTILNRSNLMWIMFVSVVVNINCTAKDLKNEYRQMRSHS